MTTTNCDFLVSETLIVYVYVYVFYEPLFPSVSKKSISITASKSEIYDLTKNLMKYAKFLSLCPS